MFHIRILVVLLFVTVSSSAGEVAWVKNFDAALRQAAQQKKFVVLDMSASWCGFCRRMAREVYPDPEFVDFSRAYVFVRLFVDTDPQGADLADRFQLRGFPTLVILNSRGEEAGRLVGARDRDRLMRDIKSITARAESLSNP